MDLERTFKRETAARVMRLEKDARTERELSLGGTRELEDIESELRNASQEREKVDGTLRELKKALQV